MRGDRDGTALGFLMAGQRRDLFDVDEDRALAELELAWADGGYHGFAPRVGPGAGVTSAGDVLTGSTPDALEQGHPGALAGDAVSSDWDGPLDELRWHWGDAYLIHFFEPGTWVAQRRDGHETMSAGQALRVTSPNSRVLVLPGCVVTLALACASPRRRTGASGPAPGTGPA